MGLQILFGWCYYPVMSTKKAVSRRAFLQSTASAVGTVTVANAAPAILSQRSPNEVIGLAQIGSGVRGYELMGEAVRIPGNQYRVVCDLYDGFLERGAKRAGNEAVKRTKRFEDVISDKDVDAIIIAAPDHWHAPIALEAIAAGKHIYLEKPFTNTLDEAKAVVKAVREKGITFQLGHNLRSSPAVWKARDLVSRGAIGDVVHVRAQHYRNSIEPYMRWYGFYNNFTMPEDADTQHIDWDRFQQNVEKHSFHPYRFFHWRCYWAYTNGVAGDLQSHALDQINAVLGMGIPDTCAATGGLYYWRDGRETPDTWNAVFDYPDWGISINYAHVAMSDHFGSGVQIMGKDGALEIGWSDAKLYAEQFSTKYREKVKELRDADPSWNYSQPIEVIEPEVSFEEASHVGDWLRAIKDGHRTRSNIDTAWEEIVTVLMAYESFKQGRKVRWDKARQEIV